MAEPQVMSPQEYGRTVLGYAPNTTIEGKELAKFRDQYARYVQTASKSFTPQIVEVPVPGTTNSERAFMTSPNSAQMMKEPQARGRYEVQDGKLYFVDGTSAMAVTNVVDSSPFAPDPRTSGFDPAAIMGMMGQQPAAPRGFFGFGGQPAPTPEPTPMPTPTPMATPEQAAPGAAPLPGTNAPTVFSVQQFEQMTGQALPPGDYQDAQGRPFSIR